MRNGTKKRREEKGKYEVRKGERIERVREETSTVRHENREEARLPGRTSQKRKKEKRKEKIRTEKRNR